MKTNYQWLEWATPLAWTVALLFFVIAEGLVLATAKYGHHSGISALNRWSMLVVFTLPLTLGFGSTARMRNLSQNPEHREIATLASHSIAILVCSTYALLAGTVAAFF